MRAFSFAIVAGGLLLTAGMAGRALAFDNSQFCVAATQIARAATTDVGTWIDRTTRNDGVEVHCNRKMMHFKRFSKAPVSRGGDAWRQGKALEWQGTHCAKDMYREAADNGWIISATVASASGESVWLACLPGGKGFYRTMP